MRVWKGIRVLLAALGLHGQAVAAPSTQEFPFEYREGLLWVEVRATGVAEPLHFLLDTGAGVSVLSVQTAQRLGLRLGRRVKVQGVGTTTTGFWPQRLGASAGEVPLPKRYLAVDLSELSQACACRVDGLIGADFFKDRVVRLDFAQKRVRLLPAGAPTQDGEVIRLEADTAAFRVPVKINGGEPQWLRLDTGCASSLQWVTATQGTPTQHYAVAVALTGLSIPVTHTRVQLGSFHFEEVPTGLHPRPLFAGEAGLLGNGLLARFRAVTLDARGGRIILEKF